MLTCLPRDGIRKVLLFFMNKQTLVIKVREGRRGRDLGRPHCNSDISVNIYDI